MKQTTISFRQMLRQLRADLIGKDSHRGVTLTYAWLANQFGHFSLGYIPALIGYYLIRAYTTWENPEFKSALLVFLGWFLFEIYNFLGPLLLKSVSTAKALYIPSERRYIFKPDWKNIGFDTFTDLLFFGLGAFSSSLLLSFSLPTLAILCGIILLLIYPGYTWYRTKTYMQYARLPVQFRLSQWSGPLREEETGTVTGFLKVSAQSGGNHLIIFGGRKSGKSLLAVGLGTEMAVRSFTCSYCTAIKLAHLLSLDESDLLDAGEGEVWTWRSASFLIIDDINPGSPLSQIFLSPSGVLSLLGASDEPMKNRQILSSKNVVWVVGNTSDEEEQEWKDMLVQIGVGEGRISSVRLGHI